MESANKENNPAETPEVGTASSQFEQYRYVILGTIILTTVLIVSGLVYLQADKVYQIEKTDESELNQNANDDTRSNIEGQYTIKSGERNIVRGGVLVRGYPGYQGVSIVGDVPQEGEFEILPIRAAQNNSFLATDDYVKISTDNDSVYHLHVVEMSSGLLRLTKLDSSDIATFEILDGGYGKDKNAVFFYANLIPSAEATNFETLHGQLSSEGSSKVAVGFDGQNYFYNGVITSDVRDLRIFEKAPYIANDNHVYYLSESVDAPLTLIKIDGIEPQGFHVKSLEIDELGNKVTFGFSGLTSGSNNQDIIYQDQVLDLNARRINCYENNTVLNHLGNSYRIKRSHPMAMPTIAKTSYIDASGGSDCNWVAATRIVLDIAKRSVFTQDNFEIEILDRPDHSPQADQFHVTYNGKRYIMQGELDFDIGDKPTSTLFVTDIDIYGDGVPEIGVLRSDNPATYGFFSPNLKFGGLETTSFNLSKSDIDNFYKRKFVGRYREEKISWDGRDLICHQLVLTEVPEGFSELKAITSSQLLINLPWSQIPEADQVLIRESDEPVSITLERYFPEHNAGTSPCYSEFTYQGFREIESASLKEELEPSNFIGYTIMQLNPVTIGETVYSSSTGRFSLSYDAENFYIDGTPEFSMSDGSFEIYATKGQSWDMNFFRIGERIYGMRRVESSAVELHDLIDSSIDRVEAELFTDLGYGYATHPSIGAGELQLYYVSKTGPIATACRTSDFLHLDAVDEPLLVCSEGLVVHRGDVLEGLNYNDLEVGDAEGKPTGYYLRDGNNIYVERRYCDTGSSYVEGAQEDIDSWRPGC